MDPLVFNADPGLFGPDEISALETAVDDFGAAVDALGDDISVEGAQTAGTALTGITTAANGVFDKLSSTCD